MSFPHLLPPSVFRTGSPPEAGARHGTSFRCPQLPTAVQACNLVESSILRKDSWWFLLHLNWIWVPKSFRAWIRVTTAIQASLFFSLKRAENIANLAPWPGSNLTSVHQLDSMGPAFSFQKCLHSSNRTLNKRSWISGSILLYQVGKCLYHINTCQIGELLLEVLNHLCSRLREEIAKVTRVKSFPCWY